MGDAGAADLAADPEAGIDLLIERGVLAEGRAGLVTTTDFEDVRGIYRDSYADADDARFRETVADLFDLDEAAAADRIEETGVTREELVSFLALRSFLEEPSDRQSLAVLAAIITEVDPGSAVPRGLTAIADGELDAFLGDHPDAAVIVFTHNCDPCREMKADLDDIRAVTPEGVALAGVDGSEAPDIRREYEVEVAPTTLVFRDGELVDSHRGRRRPVQLEEAFAAAFGG